MSRNKKQQQQSVKTKNKKKNANKPPMRRAAPAERREGLLPTTTIARMLKDPCNAVQQPGSYGSVRGQIVQVKNRFYPPGLSTGFPHIAVMWFPDYNDASGPDGTTVNANCFYWPSVDTNSPVYPVLNGWGTAPVSGSVFTSYGSITDPGFDIISSGAYGMMRTISACIKVTYIGKTSEEAGMMYALPTLNLRQLTYGGTGNFPPGIAQLIAMSPYEGERTSSMEVAYRPVNESMEFGSSGTHCITCSPAVPPTPYSGTQDAIGIGIVLTWANDITDYAFEFIKNVEIIPDPAMRMATLPPRGIDDMRSINQAILHLERTNPKWQVRTGGSQVDQLETSLRRIVLGGRK